MLTSRTLKALFVATAIGAFSSAALAVDTYTFDPTHTAITWDISHFGFSRPAGKFMSVEGTLMLNEEKPEASSVHVTIGMAGLNSGVPKLDEHLKAKDFFDMEQYPTAKFESTKVTVKDSTHASVEGNLTLRGVTKSVTLDVTLNKVGDNFVGKRTAGLTAKTTLKRSDFGMTAYLPNLGDDVNIAIEAEANMEGKPEDKDKIKK